MEKIYFSRNRLINALFFFILLDKLYIGQSYCIKKLNSNFNFRIYWECSNNVNRHIGINRLKKFKLIIFFSLRESIIKP